MTRKQDRQHVTETPDVSDIKNPDVTHEASDVDTRAILKFVLGLGVLVLVTLGLLALMYRYFESQAERADAAIPVHPMARTDEERLPPPPRLQGARGFEVEGQNLELAPPQSEYRIVRESWDKQLNSYGWVDESNGIVRIPIEEAKKLILKQGLPVRAGASAEQQPEPAATESGARED